MSTTQSPFDPISLEIMWSRLTNIAEECWITLWRTAFSMIIGDAQDFGCELLDARGESLAHAHRSMPVFNLTLPQAVRLLLDYFPPETLKEGDILITNDPWMCAGHLYDVAIVTPVFRKGKIVGLIGSIAHCSDIGGTLNSRQAREVYDEGLQIPPMKLYRAGEPNEDLFRIIHKNVRKGEMVLGDIQAQLSANKVGADRLLAFMDEYGLEDLTELANVIQNRSEQAMRDAIRAIPDGEYRSSITFPGIEEPLTLPVRVVVTGDELLVDWEGAPPQLPYGAINCTMSYTAAHSVYGLKCILSPETPSNAGCYRPIKVIAPEGSILNCRYPASVAQRTNTGWHCAPAIFRALGEVIPERVQAFTGMPMSMTAYGYDAERRLFNDHLLQGGGQGASAHGDGKSALLYPTSAANTSVELFESRTPVVIEQKILRPDSGGPGKHRGGLGQVLTMRKLYDDGLPVQTSAPVERSFTDQPGLAGGLPGGRAGAYFSEKGEKIDPHSFDGPVVLRTLDQRMTIEIAGGSGYGNPLERPLEMVQADFDEGLVTVEGLKAYGCALDEQGRVVRPAA
jgi:N-methylhydantoinase B/acetone carboxylase, alpha subunit